MCCKNFWKRIIPFFLAFCFGIFFVNLISLNETWLNLFDEKATPPIENVESENIQKGQGSASCSGHSFQESYLTCFACTDSKFKLPNNYKLKEKSARNDKSLKLFSKPHPKYTEEAKQNNIQGEVVLRITFLANGQLGSISPVKELPNGLTEQAIEAARKIKFEPALRNGKPISVTKSIQYTFTIY